MYNIPIWLFQIPNWWNYIQLEIFDLFSDSAVPDSYIPYPQLDVLSPIRDLRYPIEDIMPNWAYCLLVHVLEVKVKISNWWKNDQLVILNWELILEIPNT